MFWETLLSFWSEFFQGYASDIQQLGHTDELLTRKPKYIPSRGLEAFLPKGFNCTRPGSWVVRHHGKSKITIWQKHSFPVSILSQTKRIFPILGPQQRQPILVTCSWGSRRGENCQLQPGTTAEWCHRQPLVPDKPSSVFGLSIHQLPIVPQLQGLQLPNVPHCVSRYVTICSTVEQDCRGTCGVVVASMLKAFLSTFSIQAFGSQRASMDREGQQAVFTHFIKPFLSRNDSSGKDTRSGFSIR